MQITGRSAASKRVLATGSSEPCDSDAEGVNNVSVRLKLTATLPPGLVDKALPHELLDRLFSPFVKREGGGSGTGLAIVDKIVKIYNGSIKAYNDNGAFFEFILYDYQRSPVPEQEEG